ncbi:MAG TPA: hypothetical protein PJ982_04165 [Lacipirellulaceae bacterium]|nr:hypothetical protein [Lacipirellulaceae bacterium]
MSADELKTELARVRYFVEQMEAELEFWETAREELDRDMKGLTDLLNQTARRGQNLEKVLECQRQYLAALGERLEITEGDWWKTGPEDCA